MGSLKSEVLTVLSTIVKSIDIQLFRENSEYSVSCVLFAEHKAFAGPGAADLLCCYYPARAAAQVPRLKCRDVKCRDSSAATQDGYYDSNIEVLLILVKEVKK